MDKLGFKVLSTSPNDMVEVGQFQRLLTDEEVEEGNLFMTQGGELVLLETFVGSDGDPVLYIRHPRDLTILSLEQAKGMK